MNELNLVELDPQGVPVPAAAPRITGGALVAPSDLLRYALDNNADLDRLEKLMDMQVKWDAGIARKQYVAAMAEFKREAPTIYKDKDVSFTGTSYSHATLGGICEVVIAALAKVGISHRWDTQQPGDGRIVVRCILTHEAGHSEETSLEALPDNSGKKNSIQQLASTVTYLQRYTLLGATGLATKDMPDDDGAGAYAEPPAARAVQKMTINGERFANALASIKSGEFTPERVRKNFILSTDQETALADLEKELVSA